MNDDAISSILIIAVLLLFSAYFSATETAFSSLNRTRLRTMAEKGNSKAALALSLAEKYDQLLSSILVGNNVVNIAMSSISTLLFVRLMPDIGATVSTIVITIVVLIFGEISPKSLAKENPEKFAMVSAPIIRVVIWVLTPINFLFAQWKKLLGRIFKGGDAHRMTQDELLMLVDEASQEGGIDQSEGELLRSAIEFTDQDAEDILTHRVDLEAVPLTATKEEVAAVFSETQYSRLPVYDGSIDNIVGILHQKDFYIGTGISPKPLNALMKEPIFVPPTVKIRDLLKVLQKHKSHIAVVSDEYGGTLGIVTMEDIIEEIVGEIHDEYDDEERTYAVLNDHTWVFEAKTQLTDFYKITKIDEETFDEVAGDADTLAGLLLELKGEFPALHEKVTYGRYEFEVLEMDNRRILKVKFTVNAPAEPNSSSL